MSRFSVCIALACGGLMVAATAALDPVFEYSFPASYDGTGFTWTDLSSAGNDAHTYNNAANKALTDDRPAGFAGSLMSISGSNGAHGTTAAIDLLANAAVGTAGGFTFDVWFKWEGTYTDTRKIIDYAGTEYLRTNGGNIQFGLSNGTTVLSSPIVSNTWHHAVAVFDTSGNTAEADSAYPGEQRILGNAHLYIDGILVDSATDVYKSGFGDSLNRTIGLNQWPLGGDWNQGWIFNPAVYLGIQNFDPFALVTPAAVDFGRFGANPGPQLRNVTIANDGASQELTINSIQITGPDAAFFTVGSFPETVAAQANTDVTITFDPGASKQAFSAILEIDTNGGNQGSFDLPLSAVIFEALPAKAAVFVVNPHPDDEGLFYGGTLTYYSKVRNLPTVVMSMTSGDSGIGSQPPENRFLREDEYRNAARVYGLKYEPIFARFDDGGSSVATVETWTQFPNTGDDAADYLSPFTGNPVEYTARWIRILRPEVLLTSDNGGDYGHPDHRHTSAAVVAAYAMAADVNTTILDDEGSALAPWVVSKFYVHDTGFDDANHLGHLFHTNWEQAYDELGGATPLDIADRALLEHESQPIDPHARSYYGPAYWGSEYEASELWTMLETTVGLDSFNVGELSDDPVFTSHTDVHHGDFLENINLTLFADYLADADYDGDVDEDDLALMLGNLGQSVVIGSVASGDANGDGLVDQTDLDILHLANSDTDADGLPDGWELAHFASLAAADPAGDDDRDGRANSIEFVAGTDPNTADRIDIAIKQAEHRVEFRLPAAGGPGYAGLTRRYQLLYSPDLADWSTIVAEGVAEGDLLGYPIPAEQVRGFYRLAISIE